MIWYQDSFGHFPFEKIPDHVTHLFGIFLNPMTGSTEARRLVACSDIRSEVEALLSGERCEPYRDENWHKVFRRGGLLEWFNPPGDIYDGTGIIELRRDGWRRVA